MNAIKTNSLTKKFRQNVFGVNDLSFSVEEGEIFGFLGSNGAGKTTTINLLLDFVHPSSGNASILGYDTQEETKEVRKRVGILPEDFGLYPSLTGVDHLSFAIDSKDGEKNPEELIQRVGLSIEDGERKVNEYSMGMRQRLALGMALVGNPKVLILDEPSKGLDPNGIRLMREIAKEEAENGVTVFFSSHILSQVEAVCDRVGILKDGDLIAVDSIDGLRESINTGSVLKLKVDRKIDLENLFREDGISDVSFDDHTIKIRISENSAKTVAINKVQEKGAVIKDIVTKESSLEELFNIYTDGEDV